MGIVCIVGSLAGWTTIPLFLRWFAKNGEIDAWTANGWRYLVSALIWLPALLWAWRRGTIPRGLWRAALWPSAWNAAAQVAFGLAPYYISPGLMTFSLRIQIVFVTIAASMMFVAERRVIRTPLYLAGLGMVIVGTLLTVALNPKGLGSGTATGVLLAMGSGIGYAAYALAVRRCMSGMKPLLAFAAVSQYTAIVLFALMLAFARAPGATGGAGLGPLDHGMSVFSMQPPAMKLAALVLSAVVGIGLGHTLYFVAISRLGVAVSSAVVQLQPITVSIGAALVFGEALTAPQWVTGLAAVSGAGLILLAQRRLARAG